jgi:hypothetical protein
MSPLVTFKTRWLVYTKQCAVGLYSNSIHSLRTTWRTREFFRNNDTDATYDRALNLYVVTFWKNTQMLSEKVSVEFKAALREPLWKVWIRSGGSIGRPQGNYVCKFTCLFYFLSEQVPTWRLRAAVEIVSDKFEKGSCFYSKKFQCDGEPNGVRLGDVCDAVCIGILVVSHEGGGSEHLKRRLQYTDLYNDVSQKTKIFSANELTALKFLWK